MYNLWVAAGSGGSPPAPKGYHYVEVSRFGKGAEEQARADTRAKAWYTYVERQLHRAQVQRDDAHKREVRAFYAAKRSKKKEVQ